MPDTDKPLDAERLTRIYRKIRDAIHDNKVAFQTRDDELQEQLRACELQLLQIMDEAKTTSMKNQHGSVTRTVKTRYWSTDWHSFKEFCKENQAFDLFEQRIAQKNMREWLNANPDKIPAGLQVDSRYAVHVVKPRSKPE